MAIRDYDYRITKQLEVIRELFAETDEEARYKVFVENAVAS